MQLSADRILIATPTDGDPNSARVSYKYHEAVRALERAGAVKLPATLAFSDDIARARSRMVWKALQNNTWDWILWWDDDVVPTNIGIVPSMIECAVRNDFDVLAAPYPRKMLPSTYPWAPLPNAGDNVAGDDNCIEVQGVPFGFTLTSRRCLDAMTAHYAETEWWTDTHDKENVHETVALFRPVLTDEKLYRAADGTMQRYRMLLSEDYSFCVRYRGMGGKIMMYLGEHSPVNHVGGFVYRGDRDEVGNI